MRSEAVTKEEKTITHKQNNANVFVAWIGKRRVAQLLSQSFFRFRDSFFVCQFFFTLFILGVFFSFQSDYATEQTIVLASLLNFIIPHFLQNEKRIGFFVWLHFGI